MIDSLIVTSLVVVSLAAAQVPDYDPYVETIQMMLNADTQEVQVSVLLQSISTNDITLPSLLEQDIRTHERILAALFTNADTCVLGVVEEACIILNMIRMPGESNIVVVQDDARAVGEEFIHRLNDAFGTNAEFHSVFVHHDDTQSRALGIPGTVVGRNTVSAIYTIPQQETHMFYDMLGSQLLAPSIYQGGGFVDAGRTLALQDGSTVTFAAVPSGTNTLMQLRVSKSYNHTQDLIDPLEIVGGVSASSYFEDGFYPLNSLVRVAILSDSPISVSDTRGPLLPTTHTDERVTPADVTQAGWFFDPSSGTTILGTYLLGPSRTVDVGQTQLSLEGPIPNTTNMSQDSLLVVTLIVVAGAGAAVFYIRGYHKR